MKKKRAAVLIMTAVDLVLVVLICTLVAGAFGHLTDGARAENVSFVREMQVSVDGGPEQTVTLPHSFSCPEPGTPVTLRATIVPGEDDTVYIKSVYAPARVYLDGKLCFEFGKKESYPGYMMDPATEHHMVETDGQNQPMELKIQYLSPNTRSSLAVHPPIVGTAKEIILERCHSLGFPLMMAAVQMVYGFSLILICACLLVVDRKGLSFLWLGLMALTSGMWAFGENNFSGFMFKNSTMLYLTAFVGLFTFMIPLLHFTRSTVDFEDPRPIWGLELFVTLCASLSMALQLTGVLPLSTSMYGYHILLPLVLIGLTVMVVREAIRNHNHSAARFILPIGVLMFTALLELLNYIFRFTYVFSSLFQIGINFFLLVMGVTAGLAVKESVNLRSQERELSFKKGLVDIQIQEQASRSRLLSEHEQLLSRQRHDLRHHINAIMELAGDNPELQNYLQGLSEKIPQAGKVFCENRMVNAILSHYAALCEREQIRLDLQLAVPAETPRVDSSTLCVVFGNLLENAVEACGRMESGDRYITLHSRMQNGLLIITMDNSFNGQVRRDGQRFYSSKRSDYGIGLASVRSVALEAGGEAQFEAEGPVFHSSLYLRVQ